MSSITRFTASISGQVVNPFRIELPETNDTGSQGVIAMNNTVSGTYERLVHAGDNNVAGLSNIFVGALSGNYTTSGTMSVAVGRQALENYNSATSVIGIGWRAGQNITEGGNGIIAIGAQALDNTYGGVTPRSNTVVIGTGSLDILSNGTDNTVIGHGSAVNLSTGARNLVLGSSSGNTPATNESDNIYINNAGSLGETNTIRIGTQGGGNFNQNRTFIAGIQGVTPSGTSEAMIVDGNNQLGSEPQLALSRGGTGLSATPSDGELLIGDGGTGTYTLSTLTGGNNISIVNGAGSITVDADGTLADTFSADNGSATPSSGVLNIAGGTDITTSANGNTVTINAVGGAATALTWQAQSTNTTMSVGTGYIPSGTTGLLTLTLPASAAVGERVAIAGYDSDGWQIDQNAGQTIHFGDQDTTAGVGGNLASNNRYDSIELICVVTDTDWVVRSSIGTISVT